MADAVPVNKLALTPEEAAALTPLGEDNIRRLCRSDPTFPAFMNGNRIVIPQKPFEEWLARQAENRIGFPELTKRSTKRR
ncbi:MAG: Excisionase from transposon [Sporomusa sp.]|jgi:hypothetical protein|nr:Excisionase from transposon [Sporomusa sp.]